MRALTAYIIGGVIPGRLHFKAPLQCGGFMQFGDWCAEAGGTREMAWDKGRRLGEMGALEKCLGDEKRTDDSRV